MMSGLNSIAGSRVCLHCLTPTARDDYCHECGPAFRSLSSWGYFRMPDETGVVPPHERDAYGDFGGAATFRRSRPAAVPAPIQPDRQADPGRSPASRAEDRGETPAAAAV